MREILYDSDTGFQPVRFAIDSADHLDFAPLARVENPCHDLCSLLSRRGEPAEKVGEILFAADPEVASEYFMRPGMNGSNPAAAELAEEIARVGAWITPTESGVFIAS
jgi:hypothetical protein